MAGKGGLLALIKLRRSTQVCLGFIGVGGPGLPGSDAFVSKYSDICSDGLCALGVGNGEGARHLVGAPSCFPLSTLSIVLTRDGRVNKLVLLSCGTEESEALFDIGCAVATRGEGRTGELLL